MELKLTLAGTGEDIFLNPKTIESITKDPEGGSKLRTVSGQAYWIKQQPAMIRLELRQLAGKRLSGDN